MATRPELMPPKCAPVMHRTPPPTCRKSPVSAGSASTARMAAPAPPCRCRPEAEADRSGARVREPLPERAHLGDGQAADLGGALDRPLGQPGLELGPALRVAREPVAILGALVQHGAHQPERERRVGARAGRDVLVAARGGVGAQRVDRDDVRAALLRREHVAPLVEIGGEQVGAPQDHEVRVLEVLGIHADRAAVGGLQRGAGGRGADRRAQARGAHRGEQARAHDPALHHALGAREVVRQHRLGAVPLDRRAQAGRRRLDRLVPADALEAPLALGADSPQRMDDPVGVVQRVEVAVDLGAERAVRERIRAIAAEADGAAVLDIDQPRAGVRAVQRAGPAHDRPHGASVRGPARRSMRWRGLEPPRP